MAHSGWTTHRFSLSSAFFILFFGVSAYGLDKPSLARQFEAEQDWYRAIGVWKEVQFESADDLYWTAGRSILADLWAARQYEEGLKQLTYWQPRWQSDPTLARSALKWTGMFQYKLNRFPAAEYSWYQADDPLYSGLLLARTGREEDAKARWSGLNLPDPTLPLADSRSPVLAATLSAVLPGAGQFYTGHWFDGVQGMAFVGFFGYSAYAAWKYDSQVSHNYVLTGVSAAIAALFYVSNIYGAYKTADYYNQSKANARYLEWETEVWNRGLPPLSPSKGTAGS